MDTEKEQYTLSRALFLKFLLISFEKQKEFFDNDERFYKSIVERNHAITTLLGAMGDLLGEHGTQEICVERKFSLNREFVDSIIRNASYLQECYQKKFPNEYEEIGKSFTCIDWRLAIQSIRATSFPGFHSEDMIESVQRSSFLTFLFYQRMAIEETVTRNVIE